MLPRRFRMINSSDFRDTTRHGRRIGGPTMVMHLRRCPSGAGVLVGFAVSKAVGNAVVRNRVKRRLRQLVATVDGPSLAQVPDGTALVIRALPLAASAPERLAIDFDRAWRRSWPDSGIGARVEPADVAPGVRS